MQLPISGPPPPGTPGPVFHAPPNVMVQAPPGMMMGGPGQPPHMGPHPGLPTHPHGHPMMGPMPPDHPGPRGPPPLNLEYRIHELNKRLLYRSENESNASLWWEEFATEFFEDDATLTLIVTLEDGPKRFTIGRTLIPRYFRTIYDGGVTELFYVLRNPFEHYQNQTNTVILDCDRAMMMTTHTKPYLTQVQTDGRLICEFAFSPMPNQMSDNLIPRIRYWQFSIINHTEFVPKNTLLNTDPSFLESISKNITRQGVTRTTLNYLQLCVILEPMQELMSQHRIYSATNQQPISPRECLSRITFMKYQMTRGPQQNIAPAMMPPEEQPRNTKRRKRKGSSSGGTTTPTGSGTGKKKTTASPSPAMASLSMPSSHVDVMVVQEPSMMGGEYGEEDERHITRLENTQFDPAAAANAHMNINQSTSGLPPNLGPNPMMSHLSSERNIYDAQNLGWVGTPQSLHHHPASVSSPNTPIGRTTTPANGQSLHSQLAASPATMLSQSAMLARPLSNQNGSRHSTPNATPTSFA